MRVLLTGLFLLLMVPAAVIAAIAVGPVSLLIAALVGTALVIWGVYGGMRHARHTRMPAAHS